MIKSAAKNCIKKSESNVVTHLIVTTPRDTAYARNNGYSQ